MEFNLRQHGSDPPVALVTMPFGHIKYPSIQLGTLSAVLKTQDVGVACYYLNLAFAARIGFALYDVLCEQQLLIGEWLFSRLLFRENSLHEHYLSTFKPLCDTISQLTGATAERLREIEERTAPEFLAWAATAINWGNYAIVGFTSMFHQNLASVTLAKLIKDIYPHVRIVFGGANYDGEMAYEYFRAFPWIDYVVVGEGELTLPALVRAVLDGRKEIRLPGLMSRRGRAISYEPNPYLFQEFGRTGPPDYDDYFAQLASININPAATNDFGRILLYESARGCWWGEKHHCTFCGLNAQNMKFRAKRPEQVLADLRYLSSRYRATRFRFVDNIIDLSHIDAVFGKLAEEQYDLEIFIETKSNLSKRQIQTLARGGVKVMQPGIESLSAATLKEMDKGVSPLQNLVCLKWCSYYDIHVSWNILLGFPGECDEDYRKQIALIPAVMHFQPPECVGRFWLERFSPYFTRPSQYGIRITGPGVAYQYVYDPSRIDLAKIAYDFEYEVDHHVDPSLVQELIDLTNQWKRRHASGDKPFLYYVKGIGFITVYDGRWEGAPARKTYEGVAAFLIEACNEMPKTEAAIQREVSLHHEFAVFAGEPVRQALKELVDDKILYEEKGRYFTLALPANRFH
jgi:ribosomal peptide maturation radical SAM protein 1